MRIALTLFVYLILSQSGMAWEGRLFDESGLIQKDKDFGLLDGMLNAAFEESDSVTQKTRYIRFGIYLSRRALSETSEAEIQKILKSWKAPLRFNQFPKRMLVIVFLKDQQFAFRGDPEINQRFSKNFLDKVTHDFSIPLFFEQKRTVDGLRLTLEALVHYMPMPMVSGIRQMHPLTNSFLAQRNMPPEKAERISNLFHDLFLETGIHVSMYVSKNTPSQEFESFAERVNRERVLHHSKGEKYLFIFLNERNGRLFVKITDDLTPHISEKNVNIIFKKNALPLIQARSFDDGLVEFASAMVSFIKNQPKSKSDDESEINFNFLWFSAFLIPLLFLRLFFKMRKIPMSSPVEPNLKQDLENWANAKEIKFYWRADLVELKYYSYNFILAFVVWYIVSAFFWLKAQKMPWTFPFAEFFFYQMLGLVVGWVIGYFKPLRRLILIRSYREKNLKREVALMTSELGANVFWSSSEKMGILVLKRENTEVENVVFSESELQKVKEKGEKYFSVK